MADGENAVKGENERWQCHPPSPKTVGVAHWWSPHSYSLQISVSPRHLQARRWRSRPLRDLFSSTSLTLVIEMTFLYFLFIV